MLSLPKIPWQRTWYGFASGIVVLLIMSAAWWQREQQITALAPQAPKPISHSLRTWADAYNIKLGTTDNGILTPLYDNTIPQTFNSLSFETALKFKAMHMCPPAWLVDRTHYPDTFNISMYQWVVAHGEENRYAYENCYADTAREDEWEWGRTDERIQYAAEHNMEVYGHTLLWHDANPPWLLDPDVQLSVAERERIMEEHIRTVIRHYADSPIYAFDVVNEGIAPDGTILQLGPWASIPNYIHKAFVIARDELDRQGRQDVKLFYNDFEIEYGHERYYSLFLANPGCYNKSDGVYTYIKNLINTYHTPIDGVGFQTHLVVTGDPQDTCENPTGAFLHDEAKMMETMERFGTLGLEVKITEMDVARRGDKISDAELATIQASYFASVMRACLRTNGICTGVTVWGTQDGASWYNGRDAFPAPNPLLYADVGREVFSPTTNGCVPAPETITTESYCPKTGFGGLSIALKKHGAFKVLYPERFLRRSP